MEVGGEVVLEVGWESRSCGGHRDAWTRESVGGRGRRLVGSVGAAAARSMERGLVGSSGDPGLVAHEFSRGSQGGDLGDLRCNGVVTSREPRGCREAGSAHATWFFRSRFGVQAIAVPAWRNMPSSAMVRPVTRCSSASSSPP
jgi:hypothetical protein